MSDLVEMLNQERESLLKALKPLVDCVLLPEVAAKIDSLVASKRASLYKGLTCWFEEEDRCDPELDHHYRYTVSVVKWNDPDKALSAERELNDYKYELNSRAREIMAKANRPRIAALNERVEELDSLIEEAKIAEIEEFRRPMSECPAELVSVVEHLDSLPSFELCLLKGAEKALVWKVMPFLKTAHVRYIGGHKKNDRGEYLS